MCLLSYYPPHVLPDTAALHNGSYLNDDGHGFAIVTDRRLLVRRGLDAAALIDEFARLRRSHPAGPALFHSRLGTHGTLGTHNCHPFRIGGDQRTVLAHNGILPALVQPRKRDRRCDSRVAAEDFLPQEPFGPLQSPHAQAGLCDWLGGHNKIVILTINPRYPQNAYILNEDHGIWDQDVWYSNRDYLDPVTGPFGDSYADPFADWRDDLPLCATCYSDDGIDIHAGVCVACGTCLDCGEPVHSCFCYLPTAATIPSFT